MIALQHYRELPDSMYEVTAPAPSVSPRLTELNRSLLQQLGVNADWFNSDEGLAVLSGNQPANNNQAIALAYAGHQFGQWVPLLGDGRAHMLGQLTAGDRTIDVQLKGSGHTRFSRGGDGRATLGSVLREYIVSEAMAALSIPTTRSLAVIETGEPVMRERAHPGAILVRTAESHIRVGTFEYARSLGSEAVRSLADFMIHRHYAELEPGPQGYLSLLKNTSDRQASLIARWMLVGFIHGVMNTDNTSIVGETIDYGPCAFMDEFDPGKVFSSIDRFGRYAWDKQPSIGYWNLSRLAHALLPLIHESPEEASAMTVEVLDTYADNFQREFSQGLCLKLGLVAEADVYSWCQQTLGTLADQAIDFTQFFDLLTAIAAGQSEDAIISLFHTPADGEHWLTQWRQHREAGAIDWSAMRHANPAVIARNHRVEQAISAAVDQQDFAPFRRLCHALRSPYEVAREHRDLQIPPTPQERVTQTFCGT